MSKINVYNISTVVYKISSDMVSNISNELLELENSFNQNLYIGIQDTEIPFIYNGCEKIINYSLLYKNRSKNNQNNEDSQNGDNNDNVDNQNDDNNNDDNVDNQNGDNNDNEDNQNDDNNQIAGNLSLETLGDEVDDQIENIVNDIYKFKKKDKFIVETDSDIYYLKDLKMNKIIGFIVIINSSTDNKCNKIINYIKQKLQKQNKYLLNGKIITTICVDQIYSNVMGKIMAQIEIDSQIEKLDYLCSFSVPSRVSLIINFMTFGFKRLDNQKLKLEKNSIKDTSINSNNFDISKENELKDDEVEEKRIDNLVILVKELIIRKEKHNDVM